LIANVAVFPAAESERRKKEKLELIREEVKLAGTGHITYSPSVKLTLIRSEKLLS
jgi:hypothetical protein